MQIQLLASTARQTAIGIINGELPPETGDLEVLAHLLELDETLTAYRINYVEVNGAMSALSRVDINNEELNIAIFERDIELRPRYSPPKD